MAPHSMLSLQLVAPESGFGIGIGGASGIRTVVTLSRVPNSLTKFSPNNSSATAESAEKELYGRHQFETLSD
jgi:hypothetical protein